MKTVAFFDTKSYDKECFMRFADEDIMNGVPHDALFDNEIFKKDIIKRYVSYFIL